MRRIILTMSLFIGLSCMAQDKPYEKVYLKNGTIVEGYISSQEPGESMEVTPSWVEVTLPDSKVRIQDKEEVALSSLSKEWQKWAKTNSDKVHNNNGTKCLNLSNLKYSEPSEWARFKKQVMVIKHRDGFVKFVTPCKDGNNDPIEVYPDTVVKIERSAREENLLSGIVDVITTSKRKYDGQIIEIVPGKTITILGTNGSRSKINSRDILSQGREFLRKNQDWKQQVQYLDVIRDESNVYEGVIVNQTYNSEKNTLTIKLLNGSEETIDLAGVKSLNKKLNKAYKPIIRSLLKSNEVSIYGKTAAWSKVSGNRYLKEIAAKKDDTVIINCDKIDKPLTIVLPDNKENFGIRVYNATFLDRTKQFIGLEMSEAYEREIPLKLTEENEEVRIYTLPKLSEGYYIVERTSDKMTIAFEVK